MVIPVVFDKAERRDVCLVFTSGVFLCGFKRDAAATGQNCYGEYC